MQCDRHIYSEAYVNNVKFMYTSACGDIMDYIGFKWGIYTDLAVSNVHIN